MGGLRLGVQGSVRVKLGLGLGQVAPGALVGLAGLYGQESQHRGVLPELHAALCGEAHVFGQVIHSSWKKEKKRLEIRVLFPYSCICLISVHQAIHPHIYIHPFIHPCINFSIHPASQPASHCPSIHLFIKLLLSPPLQSLSKYLLNTE